METQAPALSVPPLTDEQKAAETLYYLNPDVSALSVEPIGGLMGWMELAVVVQHIRDGVQYNYAKLAESLAAHLGHAKRLLANAQDESSRLSRLLEEERRTGGEREPLPLEGDGGIWALQALAAYCREAGHQPALDNLRAAGHNLGWCLDDSGADKIDPTTGICPLCDYDSEPRPAPFEKPKAVAATPCQRDCQKCEKGGVSRG